MFLTLLFLCLSLLLLFIFFSAPKCSSHGLIAFYRNRRRLLHWYTDLLAESPSQTIVINRLGSTRTIVTANPLNLEHMLKNNFDNYPKGEAFTAILGDLLGNGIFNVDGEMWGLQRKLASHEFSTNRLRDFVVRVVQEVVNERLVPVLENAVQNGDVLDLQDVLRRLAFDSICKVSLGKDTCCLDLSKPLPPLTTAFDTASAISAARGAAPVSATWQLKRALNIGSEKKLKQAVKIVRSSVADIVKIKKERKIDNSSDLLSRILSTGVEDKMVIDMVISFLLAGRDTTSSAMTWLFWLLTWHHDVENKIIDEVVSIGNNNNILRFEELKEMNYLKACLCESMRLYPPVVWDSKHAVTNDVLPDGTRVFAGDRVTYFPYGMGRMEKLWGKDRYEFRPDRWFDTNGEMKPVSPYQFSVFQAGPRVCLGKEMAFIQMKYIVGTVLRRFEFRPVGMDRPIYVPHLTAFMAGGLKVKVHKRG